MGCVTVCETHHVRDHFGAGWLAHMDCDAGAGSRSSWRMWAASLKRGRRDYLAGGGGRAGGPLPGRPGLGTTAASRMWLNRMRAGRIRLSPARAHRARVGSAGLGQARLPCAWVGSAGVGRAQVRCAWVGWAGLSWATFGRARGGSVWLGLARLDRARARCARIR